MDYTRILLIPSAITLFVLLVESVFRKIKHPPFFYVKIFVIFVVLHFAMFGNLFAFDFKQCSADMKLYGNLEASMTPQHEKEMKQKAIYHKKQGKKHYNLAEQGVSLIPNLDDAELLEELFILCSGAYMTSPWSASINLMITAAIGYGLDVYKQWKAINSHLVEASHHFEMMEWYENVLCYHKNND